MSKMNQIADWNIYIDGASKGNPGEAGVGAIIYEKNKPVKTISEFIGITTNNIAEYMALIYSLQEAIIANIKNITINTDSELLYKQIKGEYKVKDNTLKLLYNLAKHLWNNFKQIDIINIPREENEEADKLAGEAIEKRPVFLQKSKRTKIIQNEQLFNLI